MTISYNADVSSASALAFIRLLFRWRGSIWKIVFKEVVVWTILYLMVSFLYRTTFFLSPEQKITFEELANYLDSRLSYIPLTFILGFFVNTITTRWSTVFKNMGYVEGPALFVGNYIQGKDRETRLVRRAIARYLCLSQALVLRDISVRVRKRFPTYGSLVKAGFLLEEEKKTLDSIKIPFDKYWEPTNWIYTLVFRARKEGKILHDIHASKLCDEIKYFRYGLQMVCNYDWVPLPLVYPQAVFLAVYMYFGVCLVSRQFIITDRDAPNKSNIDLMIPIMTIIQFFFVIGWVKVAQGLLNPFGNDDDDFECCYLLDKNLATSLCIVDDEHDNVPEIRKDRFWHRADAPPTQPPRVSVASDHPLIGSAVAAKLSTSDGRAEMVVRTAERRKSSVAAARKKSIAAIRAMHPRRHQTLTEGQLRAAARSLGDFDAYETQLSSSLDEQNRGEAPARSPGAPNASNDAGRRVSLHPSARLFTVDEAPTVGNKLDSYADFVPPDPDPSPIPSIDEQLTEARRSSSATSRSKHIYI